MDTPTRTALYLALCATVFAANEANAGCKVVSGTYMCASWIKGSELCQVTILADAFDQGPPSSVECTVMGANVTYPNGPGNPSVCPYEYWEDPQLPPGDLTCDGSTAAGPPPGTTSTAYWRIFGINGVTMNGGSTASGAVGSNADIALAGTNTKIYGDAHAVGNVTTTNGASVTAIVDSAMTPQDPGAAVADCAPLSTLDDFDYHSPGVTLIAGNLTISGGRTATLFPDWWPPTNPYCFNNITLSGGSTLEFWETTTISVKGTLQSTGGSRLANTTSDANLTINVSSPAIPPSSPAKTVTLNGSRGANVTINARSAEIKFGIGANYSGSFIGNKVTANGASSINDPNPAVIYVGSSQVTSLSAVTEDFTCIDGICTTSAAIGPPDLSTCGEGGPPATGFTADQFLAKVEAWFDGGEGLTLYQWCTLNGSTYSCTDIDGPEGMCDSGSA